jgi:hypothetical protein
VTALRKKRSKREKILSVLVKFFGFCWLGYPEETGRDYIIPAHSGLI